MHRQTITITIDLTDEGIEKLKDDLAASEKHNAGQGCEMPTMDERHEGTMRSMLMLSMVATLMSEAMPAVLGAARNRAPDPDLPINQGMRLHPLDEDGAPMGIDAFVQIGQIEPVITKH